MKWITPLFLFVLLGWWGVTEAVPTFLMADVADAAISYDPATVPYRWLSRAVLLGLVGLGLYLIKRAWAGKPAPDSSGA